MKVNDLSTFTNKFVNIYQKDKNGRYMSYNHCRKCFLDNRHDKSKYGLMTLNLYAYLASWGILRKSFLMQKDYLFNKPVVIILCKDKYIPLINWSPFNKTQKEIDEYVSLILELKNEITKYYLSVYYFNNNGKEVKIKNVTDTLVSKIILGTLGCIPAYDRYLINALKQNNIVGALSKKSVLQIIEFAKSNEKDIKDLCNELGQLYPPMKIIDMYFWEKGISN